MQHYSGTGFCLVNGILADAMGSDHITNTIKALRTRQGISQAKLGASIGVSRQTIISIERGTYIPSLPLPLALKLARFFGCPADYCKGQVILWFFIRVL